MNALTPDAAGKSGNETGARPVVLIVDDIAANRATLQAVLALQDYVILEAENGVEALDLASMHHPDLMLLDIMMPGMDGYEVLRRVRQNPDLAEMPVVLVTALDDSAALLEGFDAGADDFISKPFKAVELRVRVRGILRLNRYRTLLGEREARHRAEDEARGLEARYREVIENVHLMVQMVRPDGSIGFVNEQWLENMGYGPEEVEGVAFGDLIHPDALVHCNEVFGRVMSGAAVHDLETSFVTKEGKRLDVAGAIAPRIRDGEVVGTHAILQDVTQRKAMEAQLMQSQKMEQVGRLTAGIAHDFGNTLAVVMMNASHLVKQAPEDAPFLVDLQEIQEAAQDGLALVRDLMGFSRRAKLDSATVNLTGLVGEMVETLRRVLPSRIEVSTSAEDRSLVVQADAGTIRQMIMNLATNARDAMGGHGALTLVVDEAPAEEVQEAGHSGDFIRLSVEDTGSGMPPDILAEIFDPFFTTKDPGEGTGLGLAMLKSLLEQQGGFVTVQSTLEVGSVFHLHFPAGNGDEKAEEEA